ncbi:short-chain dehydrogenase [Pseudoalteromonas citrea]|uniref:Short-chain dehydrogenase n=1 Tax=Pseudoalteromonas citrea TaxID=43655 RepID=A0A5S3XNZ3_9GAMM|nr:SDR family oxidoreductase [Pseudoalteromonas citrea]TMP39173.1 short-chain dehydrogenase [Pseudoalteromonas citrea]TMP57162.1 short-chain dehydrogenase [Pseudoalteromonas citrea]
MANVLITGVSEGIGFALAMRHLTMGDRVVGLARRYPKALEKYENFTFISCDFKERIQVNSVLESSLLIWQEEGFSTVYLNAGMSGEAPKLALNTSFEDVNEVLLVNALVNKALLDWLLSCASKPSVVVVSASIAGQRYRAGMLAYSMSKAALEALCGVYAQEHKDVFFAVLGMCNVFTNLSENIINHPNVNDFEAHVQLRNRFNDDGYAVSAEQRADDVINIVNRRTSLLTSGVFSEVRALLP